MMDPKAPAQRRYTAQVKVELKVMVNSVWAGDCTVAQLVKQAAEEALSSWGNRGGNEAGGGVVSAQVIDVTIVDVGR